MKVAVIGVGETGLPLACQFAHRGADVVACDIRQEVVDKINQGQCTLNEPGVEQLLSAAVDGNNLQASTDISGTVAQCDITVVIVPALLTAQKDADLSNLIDVSKQIARTIQRGSMVSYETTLPVGTTRGRLSVELEKSGMKAGEDFDLVYSPERVKSLTVLRSLTSTPKVLGGINTTSAKRAVAFYQRYLGCEVIDVGSLEAAEMVKLAGMVYRDVNLALANQLAEYSEKVGVDLFNVLAACNNAGEEHLHCPGIGVGGHCTPVYPYFYTRDAERQGCDATLSQYAREINDGESTRILDRLEDVSGPVSGRDVLILGLAFCPGVKEHICSTAFLLNDLLKQRGARVSLHDPLYDGNELQRHGFCSGSVASCTVPEIVILNTAHDEYRNLDLHKMHAAGARYLLDGRGFWSPQEVQTTGINYLGIARPHSSERRATSRVDSAVPLARPVMGSQECTAAARAIRSGWVMQGPEVKAFEKEFSQWTGGSHACAVSSGTAALHLALCAAGISNGDEVITVSHSYIATVNAIRYCGGIPVLVDIDPSTYNLDPAQLERAISSRTKAVLVVHQMGMPADLSRILPVARAHGLLVIEDAACAIGSEIKMGKNWEAIGRPHGDIACFSFHPRKVLTTGEGGMITTSSNTWIDKLRSLRQHGLLRKMSSGVAEDTYSTIGYNYRLTDIQAAVGREQLKRLDEILRRRRQIGTWYEQELRTHLPAVVPPSEPDWARTNWQSYCVRLPRDVDQRSVMQVLRHQNIASQPGILNAHEQQAYRSGRRGHVKTRIADKLVHSESAFRECLLLPLFPQMSHNDVTRMVCELRQALVEKATE